MQASVLRDFVLLGKGYNHLSSSFLSQGFDARTLLREKILPLMATSRRMQFLVRDYADMLNDLEGGSL